MDDVVRSRSNSRVTDDASTSSGQRAPSSDQLSPPPPQNTTASRSEQFADISAADEGFVAVLRDMDRLITSEGYSDGEARDSDHVEDHQSTHVDGEYTDGSVMEGDDYSQVIEHGARTQTSWQQHSVAQDAVTSQQGYVATTDTHENVLNDDGSDVETSNEKDYPRPEELYARVIKPLKPKRASVEIPDRSPVIWNSSHEISINNSKSENSELNPTQHVHEVMDHMNKHIVPPRINAIVPVDRENYRVGGEWQEMVIHVGEDDEHPVQGTPVVDGWAQKQVIEGSTDWTQSNNMNQTPTPNTIATVVTVDTPGPNMKHMEHWGVSFSPDTRDNEGLSKRRNSTDGFRAPVEPWRSDNTMPMTNTSFWQRGTSSGLMNGWTQPPSSAHTNTWLPPSSAHTNTWLPPSRQQTDGVAVVMNSTDYNTPRYNPGYGRVFPGTAPMASPAAPMTISPLVQSETFPRPGALERGIRITDTDTWQRHADNRSVINIDIPTDNRSMGEYSQGPSLAGWSAHGSLNKAGSTTHPTMLATSAAYMYNKHGLTPTMNGTGGVYPVIEGDTIEFDDEKPIITPSKAEIKRKDNFIQKEKNTKKCRLIVLAVMAVIIVAVLLGVLIGLT